MPWQLVLALFLVFSSASNLFRRKLAEQYPDNPVINLTMMYLFAVVPLGIVGAFIIGDPDISGVTGWNWLQIALGGLLYSSGFVAGLKANETLDAGQFGVIATLITPVAILGSTIFLDQGLNSTQTFGVLLILLGAIAVTSTTFNSETFRPTKPTGLALLFAGLVGVGFVNESHLINSVGLATYLIVGWGGQLVAYMVLSNRKLVSIPQLVKQSSFKLVAASGLTLALSGLCVVYALSVINASVVSGVTAYQSAVTVLGSIVILRETKHLWLKIAATTIATIGLVMVAV